VFEERERERDIIYIALSLDRCIAVSYLLQGCSQDVKNEEAVQGVCRTESPSRVQGRSPGEESGRQSPQKLKSFQNSLIWSTVRASVHHPKGEGLS